MTKSEDSVKKQPKENKISTSFWRLAAGEAHYHATCRGDYSQEDDRHQETIKDTENIEEQASNKTIYFQYIVQYIMRRIIYR